MTNRTEQQGIVEEDGFDELQPIEVSSAISVTDLAALMNASPIDVIKELMRSGYMFSINEVLEYDVAAGVAPAFGFVVLEAEDNNGPSSIVISTENEDQDKLIVRPPIVTILGHVDHGKTTLLDTIRKASVVDGEAGGITQHIGAYQIDHEGNTISFLDTPGHEAFTAMRARGAQVTDIAVLVVAADDGIMPQTVEAIHHVKAAGVPIIVAINKIDRADANPEIVKQQLTQHDLLIEEWGGDVIAAPVSALTGEGIPDLLENILLVSEVQELRANPEQPARGVVVEARIDKSQGTVTTVLVQTGTLNIGDSIVIGEVRGRVRAMATDRGERIQSASPSQPVEILGIDGVPEAGDIFEVAEDDRAARQIVEQRLRVKDLARSTGVSFDDVHTRLESGEVKSLNLIVKTDVQGSIEAVKFALEGLNNDQYRVNLVHAASGGIAESDVLLAVASSAIIVGFNSPIQPGARALANQEGIEVRFYQIIYNLVEDVERALVGLLEPVYRDIVEGRATVRAIFPLGRRAKVAGFFVNDGKIARNSTVHLVRGGQQLFAGKISTLKHFKDDVREVANGFEGGLSLDGFNDFIEGDVLEAHQQELVS